MRGGLQLESLWRPLDDVVESGEGLVMRGGV